MQLKSDNPDFSFVLFKNPATGTIARELRKGTLFGWYSKKDPTTYNAFFSDSDDDISFPDYPNQEYEYLSVNRFSSSEFIANTIKEFFNHITKKDIPEDVDNKFTNTITLGMTQYRGAGYFSILTKHFPEVDVQVISKFENTKAVKLVFTSKRNWKYLLSFVEVFAVVNAIKNKEPLMMEDDRVERIVKMINIIDAPYFMRYVFKVNALRGGAFKRFSDKINTESIKMVAGSNQDVRVEWIGNKLNKSINIFDFGCGEGDYVSKFAKHVPTYFATDKDEEALDSVRRIINKKVLDNVVIINEGGEPQGDYQLLCTEVVEHNEPEEAAKIIKDNMSKENCKRVIITTPNKEFNKFYKMEEDETRHVDHKFEYTKEEFENYIETAVVSEGWKAEYFKVGDIVDGICTTQGCVLERLQ